MDWQTFYNKTYNWILTFGPRIILALVIFFAGLWLMRAIKKWFADFLSRRRLDPSLRPFLQGTITIFLQVLLILALLQVLGIEVTIFAALIGAFGVAAGLALSGTLQNFTSGILILLLKPFKVGDNIITQGQEGSITSIQLFYTVLLTFDNRTVIVPNSKLSNEVIINLSRQGTRRMDIELKFGYGVAFEKVKAIIDNAISKSANVLATPPYRVGIEAMENDGYKIRINLWVNAHGFTDARLAFQETLINSFRQADVKLPGMQL